MRRTPTMLVLLLTACDPESGETSNDEGPSGEPNEDGDSQPHCLQTVAVLDPSVDSPLGFSADALLEGKLGATETTLRFADEPTTLNPDYKGAELPLTVALAWTGGDVRFVDTEVNPEWEDDGDLDIGYDDCEDWLEVDVVVEIRSPGGEFDERVETTLLATAVDQAGLTGSSISSSGTDLYPPPLQGTFDPATLFQGDERLEHLVFDGFWNAEGAGGELMAEVHSEGDEPDGGFVGFGVVAWWGQTTEPE